VGIASGEDDMAETSDPDRDDLGAIARAIVDSNR
jgi:hypothetical protein